MNSNSIFPTSSIMIDLIINLYETNISLRVSFLLPLELCWENGAKVVLKSHLKNLQLPEILKGNTRVEAVWHPRGTDKRTNVWFRPSCIYTQIFSPIKNTSQIFFDFFYLYSMQLFRANPTIFSKKF